MKDAIIKTCPNCSSSKIEKGIAIAQSSEVGNVGPKYQGKFYMTGVSQLYCDLCLDCGEIARMFIKDRTDRKWIKTPGSIGSI